MWSFDYFLLFNINAMPACWNVGFENTEINRLKHIISTIKFSTFHCGIAALKFCVYLFIRRWRRRCGGGRGERWHFADETCFVQSWAEPHHRLAGVLHTGVTPGSALTPHPLISLKKSPPPPLPLKSFQPPKPCNYPRSCKSSPLALKRPSKPCIVPCNYYIPSCPVTLLTLMPCKYLLWSSNLPAIPFLSHPGHCNSLHEPCNPAS